MNINDLRKEIDKTDDELVKLLSHRMKIAAEIGKYKRENSLPVLDIERERELLGRVGNLAGEELSSYIKTIYTTVMDTSRAYQRRLFGGQSELAEKMKSALENTPKLFPEKAVVACQGVAGAYSQFACEKVFKEPSIMYFGGFEDVFRAVEKGFCKYGILPIENSTAGSVNKIYDLMAKYKFYIVRSVRIQVSHSLLSVRGSDISKIREIYSHEQAISQCAEFLAAHPEIHVNVCENTAVAARMVSELGREDTAALSAPQCAALYDLVTIEDNVCDFDHNYTRFICISKNLEIYPGAEKTSLMLKLAHKPGSLHRIIARFQALGINLEKLESRPKAGSDFEFLFYFDIGASVYSEKLFELMCELELECDGFKYLGSYSEII